MLTVFVESKFPIGCILLKVKSSVGHHDFSKVLNQIPYYRFTFSTTENERLGNFDDIRIGQSAGHILWIRSVSASLLSSSPFLWHGIFSVEQSGWAPIVDRVPGKLGNSVDADSNNRRWPSSKSRVLYFPGSDFGVAVFGGGEKSLGTVSDQT